MQSKLQVNSFGLKKAAVFLAFFGLLSARDVQALGLPPLITVPPLGLVVHNGDTATFTTIVGISLTSVTVKWYLGNDELKHANISTLTLPLVGTTVSTLTITNATSARAGNYWVKVENGGGEVKSGNALLVVLDSTLSNVVYTATLLTSQCRMTNGGFRLQMTKPATSNCVLDASADLRNWTPVYTNTSGSTNFSFLDTAAANLPFRYYRVRLQ